MTAPPVDIEHAKTDADVCLAVRLAVFNDRERSLEGAVVRAVRAGIAFERARIGAILKEIVPRPGMERILVIQAIEETATVGSVRNFMNELPLTQARHARLRKTLHIVAGNSGRS